MAGKISREELNDDLQQKLDDLEKPTYSEPIIINGGIGSLPKNAANGQVGGVVKGETLTNLANNGDSYENWQVTYVVEIVNNIITIPHSLGDYQARLPVNLKPNTSYTIFYNIVDKVGDIELRIWNNLTGNYIVNTPNALGQNRILIKTQSTITDNRLRFYAGGSTGDTISITDIMVFEGDYTDRNIPYITGTKSTVSAMRLKSVGKNLFDGELENGSLDPQGQPADMLDRLRSKNFIRVKNNEKITLSSSSGAALSYVDFYFYDINKRFISCVTTGATMTTTPSNCSFVKFRLATIDDVLSLNYGSQGFYEPYTESNAYVVAKDKNGNIAELRSLENETKDEIRVSGGKAELVKRIDDLILDGSLDWAVLISSEGVKKIRTSIPVNASLGSKNTRATYKETQLIFNTTQAIANLKPGEYFTLTTSGIRYFYIAIDDLDSGWVNPPTKQDMKNFFNANPITLTYQLAEPEIIELPTQSLTAYSGGTIYVEPIVKETAVYGTGITIKDPSVPIKKLERVTKINLNDNSRMDIPISSCTVASDGLSFTSAVLGSKDTIEYEYEYDQALSTTPTLEVVANMNLKAQVSSHDKTISSINQELSNFSDMTLMWIIELDSRLTALEGV